MMLNILSIGGSDPSSGAGIQGDIRACESLGSYCLGIVTMVTSQNTIKFGIAESVSTRILKQQLKMVLSDFKVSAVKIGMVHNTETIKIVADMLAEIDVPVVLDPVMQSTTGGMLIRKDAITHLKKLLIPLSTIITPNVQEAELLTGLKIRSTESIRKSSLYLQQMGADNVVITGIIKRDIITDHVLAGNKEYRISHKKLPRTNHGGGCNYSLAICHALARKRSIIDAVQFAGRFAYESIRNSGKIGTGKRITLHSKKNSMNNMLENAIDEFARIKNIHEKIPECQTNFVFSKARPASTSDIMGVDGRIVRTGSGIMVAGEIRYGGSKHVASAVLVVAKQFPSIRSAVNIKFEKSTISTLKKTGLTVLRYDRRSEPANIKNKEGKSIAWGISTALKRSSRVPDVIFHCGDHGKEPMIIIFGRNPVEVIRKLQTAFT